MKFFGFGNKQATSAATAESPVTAKRHSKKASKKAAAVPNEALNVYWEAFNQSEDSLSQEFLARRDAQKKKEERQSKVGSQEFMKVYE